MTPDIAPTGAPRFGRSLDQVRDRLRHVPLPLAILLIGVAILATPTMLFVASATWTTEQGGHGPIVMATGFWLLWRLFPDARPYFRVPPTWRPALLFALLVPVYFIARISQIVEVEGFAMYGLLLIALYSVIGGRAMRKLWFPLVYISFMFPPPDTVVAFVTLPMKTLVSQSAIGLLSALGYPIGGAGVTILIGQYELLVAAACSGLNSIISLSAISLFYVYVRHQADPVYSLLLTLTVVPIALLANFVRVLVLILLTYYMGDAPAQGFLHDFAGLLTFAVALGTIILVDAIGHRLWVRFARRGRENALSPALSNQKERSVG
ncbi:exosortase V [Sphingomonas floccifaciens]|uniref:Exosortase V n=1 Tax=Sphingomonas floccifaciens TaxID=1844115 RepID=A0ABW4NEI2_9SPHN